MCKVALLPFSCGHRIVVKFDICDLGPCPRLHPKQSQISTQKVPCMDCQRAADPSVDDRSGLSRRSTISSASSVSSLRRWRTFSFFDSSPKEPYLNFACLHDRQLSYTDLPKPVPRQKHSCMDCQVTELREHIDREVIEEADRLWPKVRKDRKNKGLPRREWMAAEAYETFISEERGDGKQLAYFVMRKWDQDLRSFGVLTGLAPVTPPSSMSSTPDSASR